MKNYIMCLTRRFIYWMQICLLVTTHQDEKDDSLSYRRSLLFWPSIMTIVPSAKRIENRSINALEKSFRNTTKKGGPKIRAGTIHPTHDPIWFDSLRSRFELFRFKWIHHCCESIQYHSLCALLLRIILYIQLISLIFCGVDNNSGNHRGLDLKVVVFFRLYWEFDRFTDCSSQNIMIESYK